MREGLTTEANRVGRVYGLAAGLVGTATILSASLRRLLAAPDVVMIFLLVIMIVASRFGRRPALVSSALSVASYDFFFVPPFYTFAVDEARHVLTFATMFIIGAVMSGLTQRIRRQEEVARVAELRVRTEEMRNALLSAVSHDFRTPLATITGAATTLREFQASMSATQRGELVEAICEEADRLERLIVNVLDMTRIESGDLVLTRQWIPLDEIIGSALTRLESQLSGRPVHITVPDDLPLASIDPVLVEQLFMNLLENAVKYTPRASPIEIAVQIVRGAHRIEVRDRGPGLPAGDPDAIFLRFHRGPSIGIAGAGLGLPICRGICSAHGGSIEAVNRQGGGAVFRIILPQVGAPPRRDDLVTADRLGSSS